MLLQKSQNRLPLAHWESHVYPTSTNCSEVRREEGDDSGPGQIDTSEIVEESRRGNGKLGLYSLMKDETIF